MPTNGQFTTGEVLTASDTNTLLSRGYQNRIINGAFVINQRSYTSGTNLASGSYGFDRWKSGYTNTALTFTAGSQSTTVTISTSGVIQQIIERENIPAGTYTLSWTGTATGRVYNSGGTAPAYAASPVQVTLDGTANVVVEFTASGATKTLSLVQLEGGTVYSPFAYRLRSEELALCQRYYWQASNIGGYNFMQRFTPGVNYSNSVAFMVVFPMPMRAAPVYSHVSGSSAVDNYGAASGITYSAQFMTTTSGRVSYTTAGLTDYRPYFAIGNADLVTQFTAEL
jgi:hypothetical protein